MNDRFTRGTRRSARVLFRGAPDLILMIALLIFEYWSFGSSKQALDSFWGHIPLFPRSPLTLLTWSNVIAFCLLAIDFYGLLELLLPGVQFPGPSKYYMFAAWALCAIGDTFLAFYVIKTQASASDSVMRGIMPPDFLTLFFPIFAAVLLWLVQVLLVSVVSGPEAIDRFQRSFQSPGYRPAPTNTSSARVPASQRHYRPTVTGSDDWGDDE